MIWSNTAVRVYPEWEILDFVSREYAQYAWNLRTLRRRLAFFDIKYIDYNIELEDVEAAVRAETSGPGQLLGYRAMQDMTCTTTNTRDCTGLYVCLLSASTENLWTTISDAWDGADFPLNLASAFVLSIFILRSSWSHNSPFFHLFSGSCCLLKDRSKPPDLKKIIASALNNGGKRKSQSHFM